MDKYIFTSNVVELLGPGILSFREELIDSDNMGSRGIIGRTLYTAISPGTEVSAYVGDPPLRPMKVYPRVVGYCNVGEVLRVGNDVSKYKAGDKIITFQSHRTMFKCTENEVVALIPKTCSNLIEASTTYLFHLGYNALLKSDFRPGMSVAVIGLGTLGLTTIALASSFGADVHALSDQESSLGYAFDFGAQEVYRKSEFEVEKHLKDCSGGGVDIVILTSNAWDDWLLAVKLARKGGGIAVIGFPGRLDPKPPFNPLDSRYFYDSQLKIISCGYTSHLDVEPHDIRFNIKRNCEFLLKKIIKKQLPAQKIISSIVQWREIESVYKLMASREKGHITSVLDWT